MRTQSFLKQKHLIFLLTAALFVVTVALLAGCGANDETPLVSGVPVGSSDQEPTAALNSGAVEVSVDAEATDEDAGEESPPDPVAAAPDQANTCLNCHSDKEQLIATAAPEQEVEAESEGEG